MPSDSISIARRFRGPLLSGNGGYCAGLLAQRIDGPAEVTLRIPPPLERELAVEHDGDRVLLLDGARLVAEARPQDTDLEYPTPPTRDLALAASSGSRGWPDPEFAECFVCGDRADGSGLAIHPGRVPGRVDMVAATWVARAVSPEIVWASIDCPGAYAAGAPGRGAALLGRMSARIDGFPEEDEHCVIVGWPLGADRRKLFAGTALFGEDGRPLAIANQVWFVPLQRS